MAGASCSKHSLEARSKRNCRIRLLEGCRTATVLTETSVPLECIDVVRLTILLSWLVASPASAAEVIEALGGEKCGGAARSYSVEFLAPENAQVEARGKVMIGGKEVPDTPGLSLDDKPCPDGRCSFRATKGQTYKLTVESTAQGSNELCVSVARP